MMRMILVVVLVGACGHKSAECDGARTELKSQIEEAIKASDETESTQQAALVAAETRLSTAKEHDTSLTQTLGQVASKYGCEPELVCCTKAKPLDGLEDWAQSFLDVDAKPFTDAARALRAAPAKDRAAACARTNAALDAISHAAREKLAKQTADATADEKHAKDAKTAAHGNGAVLTRWRDALVAGSGSGLDAGGGSDAIDPVRAKVAAYIQKCR